MREQPARLLHKPLAALVLLLSSPAWGQSIVQHTTGSSFSASLSLSYGSANTAANLLLAFVQAGGSTAPTVSDSVNGSWTQATLASGRQIGVFYLANCKSGSNTVTVNVAGSTSTELMIVEVSGVATSSPLDVAANSTGFGGANPNTSITTTAGGDFIFGAMLLENLSGSADASFTAIDNVGGGDADEWTTQASSGSITVKFDNSNSGSGGWYVLAAAFKGAGSGTGPDSSGDPRRIGVRPTGSYWGASGEQIDLQSGNLNFLMPEMQAQLGGATKIPFALSYNSQLWRQDPTGVSNLGQDVGYGYGWRFQAASILPVYLGSPLHLDHYIYSDATGAQYRLDQNAGNVWTSLEGTFVSYDANANRLYFTDGSFWVMGDTSAVNEPDALTQYPTLMEDRNGNQIVIRYQPGAGGGGSARIYEIQDSRRTCRSTDGNTYTFLFTYDATPHLTQIASCLQYDYGLRTFGYLAGQTILSPFNSVSFGTANFLSSASTFDNRQQTFQYSAAGEMSGMTTPFGGSLAWQYRTYTYGNGVSYREIQSRQMTPSAGGTTYTWNVALDNNPNSHASTTVSDLGAGTQKVWTFQTAAGLVLGLAATYEEHDTTGATLLHKDYTWSQNGAGNVYTSAIVTTLNPGASYQAQTKTAQTIDNYGNVTQSLVYDYNNLSAPARTYSAVYVTDSNYTSRYIRNLLWYVNVTPNGGGGIQLAFNVYDSNASYPCYSALQDQPGLALHDSNYNVNFTYRGNPTQTYSLGALHCYGYQINGAVFLTSDG